MGYKETIQLIFENTIGSTSALNSFKNNVLKRLPLWFLRFIAQAKLQFFIGPKNACPTERICIDPSLKSSTPMALVEITGIPTQNSEEFPTQIYTPSTANGGLALLEQYAPSFIKAHFLFVTIAHRLLELFPELRHFLPIDNTITCPNNPLIVIKKSPISTDVLNAMKNKISVQYVGENCSFLPLPNNNKELLPYNVTCDKPAPSSILSIPDGDPKDRIASYLDMHYNGCQMADTSSPITANTVSQPLKDPESSWFGMTLILSFSVNFLSEIMKNFRFNNKKTWGKTLNLLLDYSQYIILIGLLYAVPTQALLLITTQMVRNLINRRLSHGVTKEINQFLIAALTHFLTNPEREKEISYQQILLESFLLYSQLFIGKKAGVYAAQAVKTLKPNYFNKNHGKTKIEYPQPVKKTQVKKTQVKKTQVEKTQVEKTQVEKTQADIVKQKEKEKKKKKKHGRNGEIKNIEKQTFISLMTTEDNESDTEDCKSIESEKIEPQPLTTDIRSKYVKVTGDISSIQNSIEELSGDPSCEGKLIAIHITNPFDTHDNLKDMMDTLIKNNIRGMITGGAALQIIELLLGLRQSQDFNPHDLDIIASPQQQQKIKEDGACTLTPYKKDDTIAERLDVQIENIPPIEIVSSFEVTDDLATKLPLQITEIESQTKKRHTPSKSCGIPIDNESLMLIIPANTLAHICNKRFALNGPSVQPKWILMAAAMLCEGYSMLTPIPEKELDKLNEFTGFGRFHCISSYLIRYGINYLKQLATLSNPNLLQSLIGWDPKFNYTEQTYEVFFNALMAIAKREDNPNINKYTALLIALIVPNIADFEKQDARSIKSLILKQLECLGVHLLSPSRNGFINQQLHLLNAAMENCCKIFSNAHSDPDLELITTIRGCLETYKPQHPKCSDEENPAPIAAAPKFKKRLAITEPPPPSPSLFGSGENLPLQADCTDAVQNKFS